MNSIFQFHLEWEAVPGSRLDENRATWARLALYVDDQPITRVLDLRSRGYRDHILVPLYPLTEWLVTHWWLLFYEPQAAGRSGYNQRHNLRFGREGYAFPDLVISPLGQSVSLEWGPPASELWRVSFHAGGRSVVERVQLEEELTQLVEAVTARLEQQGITESLLQHEWTAIQEADQEEREFCVAAAQLGQDPYRLSPETANLIEAAGRDVPRAWQDEFFSAADITRLASDVEYTMTALAVIREQARCLSGRLPEWRVRSAKSDCRGQTPWQQGYEMARWLRLETGIGHDPLPADESLALLLGVDELPILDTGRFPEGRWLDALVDASKQDRAGFVTTARRPENRRFAFCRALFEYLTAVNTPSALVTTARTERQKRNRAFAAELLAPAAWLRQRFPGEFIGVDDLGDASDELGVSSEVLHYQLQNHRIAEIV